MRIAVISAAMAVIIAALVTGPAPMAAAQGLFKPVIKVNDKAITGFEIEQRARLLTLFRTPGDPVQTAREQLVEDRLKLDAAEATGIVVSEEAIDAAVEEFAGRAGLSAEEMTDRLGNAGVDASTLRDFVRVGVVWRDLVTARFAGNVAVGEDDVERAKLALSGTSGVRVLLSEIVLPILPGQAQAAQQRAQELSKIQSVEEFGEAARRYSVAPSADSAGRLDWTAVSALPETLQPVVLALSPGEVSTPLATENAMVLLMLRDIAESGTPEPRYSAIEYAIYYIDGGRSEAALSRAAKVRAQVDTCDDLYGIAQGQPPEVLSRQTKAPDDLPQDVARELSRLDPGEISTNLTRSNGQTLALLMLCGRSPRLDGEGPSVEELNSFIRSRRLDSYAKGYLEQLRAEARIVELQ